MTTKALAAAVSPFHPPAAPTALNAEQPPSADRFDLALTALQRDETQSYASDDREDERGPRQDRDASEERPGERFDEDDDSEPRTSQVVASHVRPAALTDAATTSALHAASEQLEDRLMPGRVIALTRDHLPSLPPEMPEGGGRGVSARGPAAEVRVSLRALFGDVPVDLLMRREQPTTSLTRRMPEAPSRAEADPRAPSVMAAPTADTSERDLTPNASSEHHVFAGSTSDEEGGRQRPPSRALFEALAKKFVETMASSDLSSEEILLTTRPTGGYDLVHPTLGRMHLTFEQHGDVLCLSFYVIDWQAAEKVMAVGRELRDMLREKGVRLRAVVASPNPESTSVMPSRARGRSTVLDLEV